MPVDMSEEAVARLLWDAQRPDADRFAWEQIDRMSKDGWLRMARAVLALVRAKVREAVRATDPQGQMVHDEIVDRVMGVRRG